MKLFGYYVLHSLKNQFKKLFKTWILIFVVVCFLIGGISAGLSSDSVPPEDPGYSDALPPEETSADAEVLAIVELIAGGIVLALFVFMAFGADKNGSRIFLPADVNLLFPSPLQPQSVLLFRLLTQLGMVLLSTLYLGFQLLEPVAELRLGIGAGLALIIAWLLTVAIAQLLQLLLYTTASTKPLVKKYLRAGIFGFLSLIALSFFLFACFSGLSYYEAAKAFFNGSITRFLPLWGWLKGLCMYALEGNALGAILSGICVIWGGGALVYIIWQLPADFYEEAMAKSQETAELLEAANAEKSLIFVKRKKDRSENIRRDGLNKGWGANVFYYRLLYNRSRFACLGFFTKTSITYLAVAVLISLVSAVFSESPRPLPVVLTLAVFVFLRTLGNSLVEDTSKDFFRLIPEGTGRKLFYSLLGNTVCCLLDLVPALTVTLLLTGARLPELLAWSLFIVSIHFYGTNVGAFIDLSVPTSAGKSLKQVVQILFIYFGLLPDIIIMAIGLIGSFVAPAAVGAAALNTGLGFLFFSLTPLFLDPRIQPQKQPAVSTPEDTRRIRKQFSFMGWSCFTILAVSSVFQALLARILPDSPWRIWIFTFIPLYLLAMPIGIAMLDRIPRIELPKAALTVPQLIKVCFISLFMMYGGNFISVLLTSLLAPIAPDASQVPVTDFVTADSLFLKILVIVMLAPVLEELIFRKLLIDRMSRYGGKLAVVTSALLFGLLHGNLSQFIYAGALGLVLGYVYLSTGRLRYSIGIHMGVNFLGSIVSSWFLENLDLEALSDPSRTMEVMASPAFLGYLGFLLFILASTVVGLVLLCRSVRDVHFDTAPLELGKGKWKLAWGNAGMIAFTLLCGLSILLTLFA